MKQVFLTLSLVALLLPLRADDFFQNNDFSEGKKHWDGNFKLADTGTVAATPSSGLIIQLQTHEWTYISQAIDAKTRRMKFVIRYTLSDDTVFTHDVGEYQNIQSRVGLNLWSPVSFKELQGDKAMIFYSEESGRPIGTNSFSPKIGTPEPAVYYTPSGFHQDETKETVTIAFPPGHGTLTLFQVSGTDYATNPGLPEGVESSRKNGAAITTSEDFIKNGDFKDGKNYWFGDVKSAADEAPSGNGIPGSEPTTKPGLVIHLKSSEWTKATTEFSPTTKSVLCHISYELSPDAKSSLAPGDSGNISSLSIPGWNFVKTDPESFFYVLQSEVDSNGKTLFGVKPKTATGLNKFALFTSGSTSGHSRVALSLIFPPGKGTVTLRLVSMLAVNPK